MFRQFFLLFISSTTVLLVDADDCVTVESEGPGNWQGLLQLGPFEEDVTSWNIIITFTDPLDWLESVMAEVSGTGTSWSLASKDWDGEISAGESLGVRFRVGYSGNKVILVPKSGGGGAGVCVCVCVCVCVYIDRLRVII